ncbi:hypothetical protein DFJ73DRAFT_834977 [Zopfochytrium polystomum]|nr:hypothetical protein DFJ73DRAFT_834977 [Zopfochytrium polystomum]
MPPVMLVLLLTAYGVRRVGDGEPAAVAAAVEEEGEEEEDDDTGKAARANCGAWVRRGVRDAEMGRWEVRKACVVVVVEADVVVVV